MTKTKIGTTDEKAPLPEYTPQGEQQQVSVMMPAQVEVFKLFYPNGCG